MANINNLKKNLIKTLDNLNQTGGERKYSKSEVDQMLMSSFQNMMYLYQNSLAERKKIQDQIDEILNKRAKNQTGGGNKLKYRRSDIYKLIGNGLKDIFLLYVQSENDKQRLLKLLNQLQMGGETESEPAPAPVPVPAPAPAPAPPKKEIGLWDIHQYIINNLKKKPFLLLRLHNFSYLLKAYKSSLPLLANFDKNNYIVQPNDRYNYKDDSSNNGAKIQAEFDKIGMNYTNKNNLVFFNYENFTEGALDSVDTEFQKMYEATIPTSSLTNSALYTTMSANTRTPLVLSAGDSFVDNDLNRVSTSRATLATSILNNRYRLLKDKVKQLVNVSADDLFIDSAQTEEDIKAIKYEPSNNEDFYNLFSGTFRTNIQPDSGRIKVSGSEVNYADLAEETKVAIQFMRSHIEEAIEKKLIIGSKVVP